VSRTPLLVALLALGACGNGDDSLVVPPPVHLPKIDAGVDATVPPSLPDAAAEAMAPIEPHPQASMTTVDMSKLRTRIEVCPSNALDEFGNCPVYLCCLDNSTCGWQQCEPAPPGRIMINVRATIDPASGPAGAYASTITSPPFHGLCFTKPDASIPDWCETITPVGDVSVADLVDDAGVPESSENLAVLVTASSEMAGDPPYQYEVCYLPGTLAADAGPGCRDMGGYCCYPPHSMGPLDDAGWPSFGIAPGDYWFALHSIPDISGDGPMPFGTWGNHGVTTDVP
jgi:hypothetical protein